MNFFSMIFITAPCGSAFPNSFSFKILEQTNTNFCKDFLIKGHDIMTQKLRFSDIP